IIVLIAIGLIAYQYWLRSSEQNLKIVVYAYEDSITGIDPSLEFDTGLVVLGTIYEPLLYYNPEKDELIPALAESWESNENGTIWTFHLRKDAKFHDGTPVTAKAVKFSIERTLKAYVETGEGPGYIWEGVKEIRVIDDYTVQFILDRPMRLDLIAAASYGAYIYSPKVLEYAGVNDPLDPALRNWFDQGNEAGSGPYKITYYNPEAEIRLEKFEEWWGWKVVNNPNAPDIVIIKIVPDSTAQLNGLKSGAIDIATQIPLGEIKNLIKEGYRVRNETTYHNFVLMFNTKRYPTNITEFRLAIAHSIPWDRVVQIALKGFGRPGSGIIPYGFPGHLSNYTYTYNKTLARQLLEKAGLLNKNIKVEIMVENTYEREVAFAEILKGELKEFGIEVEILAKPWDTMVEVGPKVWEDPESAPHMIINDWWPTIPSSYDFLYNLLHSDVKEWNWAGYENEEFENLIDEAWEIEGVDYEHALKLYTKAQDIIYYEVPAINLWDEIQPYVYNPRIELREEALNPLYMFVIFFQYVEVKG
ncbi:MAG: ABC transporter substrate-binding protein, partial [Staphylothermus sp.]|nr:ABC transporter substrate-binding protein [Staphylothermus sp.]